MSKHVDTAFELHFSEPPVVAVKEGRTHCEACKEPLDPAVMHKCHGNKEYQAPVISSTEITALCQCGGKGILHKIERAGIPSYYVVVCEKCRSFFYPEVATQESAIHGWNVGASSAVTAPKWLAALPGDDERANIIASDGKPSHPDLTDYTGACVCEGQDPACTLCQGTGVIE